jgi:hypothetical protein
MAHKVKVINGKAPSGGVGGVSDSDLSNIANVFFTKGIAKVNDYKVQAQGTPNMTVQVLTGIAYVPNPAGSMLYVSELDANANATINSNSSGNPRIDAVVIKIDLGVTPNNHADNVVSIVVIQGTPAASPVAPTDGEIQTAIGASNCFLRLANVTVANGASSITNANIADARLGCEIKLLSGRFKYSTASSKLQFSHDGTNYKDVGSGTVTPAFTVVGTLAVGTDQAPVLIAPFALTIKKAFARVKTVSTGASILIDINKNGTSIWATNQGNRLAIAASANSGTQTNFDTTSLAEGDYLSLDIDQVGSTIAGADITIELYCEAA